MKQSELAQKFNEWIGKISEQELHDSPMYWIQEAFASGYRFSTSYRRVMKKDNQRLREENKRLYQLVNLRDNIETDEIKLLKDEINYLKKKCHELEKRNHQQGEYIEKLRDDKND